MDLRSGNRIQAPRLVCALLLNEEREVNETGMPVSILFLSGVLAELGSTPIAPFVAAFPQGKKRKTKVP